MSNREKTIRVHLMLYEADWEAMDALFSNNMGKSAAVREMVRNALKIIRAKAQERDTSLRLKGGLEELQP